LVIFITVLLAVSVFENKSRKGSRNCLDGNYLALTLF